MLNDPKAARPCRRAPGYQQETSAEERRRHLDLVVEDVAGKLEKKAKHIRTAAGMIPCDLNREQYEAMLNLILNMR